MSSSARLRWIGYAVAAVLTIAAMGWVGQGDESDGVVLPSARMATPGPSRPAAEAPDPAAQRLAATVPLLRPRQESDPLADPFDAAQEVAAAAAPARPVQAEPQPVAPPSAPPLPFSYVGRWTEHGKTTIYLLRKDRPVAVLDVGRLDDEYSVQSIDEQGMVFKYAPVGTLQGLRFDAPPPVVASAAATSVAGRAAVPTGPAPAAPQNPPSANADGSEPQPEN